ncbi:MAG: protoheme IX farnesyltransferase [Burkholderiales bacterium]|nr:protoheme IX farnesyltransferase [Burkholderiales bacterium]
MDVARPVTAPLPSSERLDLAAAAKLLYKVFKLRIGLLIGFTALAGFAVTPGPSPGAAKVFVLVLATVISSAAAGAFNQYVERDLDVQMTRTRRRPFVTGALTHGPAWLWLMALMTVGSVGAAALVVNPVSALYVFLGAFFYAVVYTVWLKRRTWWNIVIGGLAGSFAVLAGAAAVTPSLSPEAIWLAVVLFLWTPPHFWSLAMIHEKDYAAAGVPMLPVVFGFDRSARIVFANTVLLVAASIVPFCYGMGWIYLGGAVLAGGYFLFKSLRLARAPSRATAAQSFGASLVHLSVLLVGVMVDAAVR